MVFESEQDTKNVWYLDNGASNHMSGDRMFFVSLDERVTGKVRFGDDSRIDIQQRPERDDAADRQEEQRRAAGIRQPVEPHGGDLEIGNPIGGTRQFVIEDAIPARAIDAQLLRPLGNRAILPLQVILRCPDALIEAQPFTPGIAADSHAGGNRDRGDQKEGRRQEDHIEDAADRHRQRRGIAGEIEGEDAERIDILVERRHQPVQSRAFEGGDWRAEDAGRNILAQGSDQPLPDQAVADAGGGTADQGQGAKAREGEEKWQCPGAGLYLAIDDGKQPDGRAATEAAHRRGTECQRPEGPQQPQRLAVKPRPVGCPAHPHARRPIDQSRNGPPTRLASWPAGT